jgi:hypothetical protein
MSEWKKVRGNNVVARQRRDEGLIMTADESCASSGFYILMEKAHTGGGRWFFLCGHQTERVSVFVSHDELVEVTFGNTRIRANPSKGWVHLLRK